MSTLTADQALALKALPATEREMCRRSFRAFLDHVMILEPPPGDAVMPWQPWPHLLGAVDALLTHRLIVWLKARQTGASWLVSAYALWMALFKKGAQVALFSQGEKEAQELLGKVRFIWQHLPDHLRDVPKVDNSEELSWADRFSRVVAYPSTAKAGRGSTFSLVVMDECDHHEFFEDNYAAVKPTIDSGGQLLLPSTANWQTADSAFKRLYRGAPGNGFTSIFWPYSVRPGRDAEWLAAKLRESTDPVRFQKEYPVSAEEALAAPQTIMAFSKAALDAMMQETREATAGS